jgi:hypothetical protein
MTRIGTSDIGRQEYSGQPEYDDGVKSTVWTTWRKVAGNLFPGLLWAIPTTWGVVTVAITGQYFGKGLILVVIGFVLGWLSTNFLGLFQNRKMRRELEEVIGDGLTGHGENFFVGLSQPGGGSTLDPHDRVGFLALDDHHLRFVDDLELLEIDRKAIKSVTFRPNIHSIFGLGRWIAVEAGEEVWLIEPRVKNSLLANKKFSKTLRAKLIEWAKI